MGTRSDPGQRELFAPHVVDVRTGLAPTADVAKDDVDDNRIDPGTLQVSRALARRNEAAFAMVSRRSGARRR